MEQSERLQLTGYTKPIATYGTQGWYQSKTDPAKFEKLQEFATKWILKSNSPYKARLIQRNPPPLSLNKDLRDLFLLLSLALGKYDVILNFEHEEKGNAAEATAKFQQLDFGNLMKIF